MYQSHLEKLSRTRLDDVLLDEGVLERSHLQDAQAEQELTGKTLSCILLDRSALDEWELAKLVSTHYSLPFVDITDLQLGAEEELLPLEFCTEHSILPLERFGATFTLAVSEMPAPALLDEIIERSGLTPFLYVAVRRQIRDILGIAARKRGISAFEEAVAEALHGPLPAKPATASEPGMQVSVAAHEAMSAIQAFSANFGEAQDGLVPIAGLPFVDLTLSASVQIRSSADSSLSHSHYGSNDGSAAAEGPPDRSWESIFDFGDDAVSGP